MSAEAELSAALESLRALGLIQSDNRLLAHHALLMDPAYVHIGPQTEKQIQRWKEDLAGMDIYSIGRYGSWRYCSMEDCMIEAAALAKQLEKERNSA